MICDNADMIYPLYADIYYPIIGQGGYGEIKKEWVFDRTVACSAASPMGRAAQEELKPEVFLQYVNKLVSRTRGDVRLSSKGSLEAVTNILITNIRSSNGEILYKETAGPRSGRGTIYEIATIEPFIGPFGDIEYYKMVWRRTENQTVGD